MNRQQPEDAGTPHAKPTERAWLDAKREMADKNDAARRAGQARRAAHERNIAALLHTQRDVYR